MSDLLSELKTLPSFDIDKYGETTFYDSNELVHGDFLNTDDVLFLIKKYGWHDVSEQPPEPGEYFVTLKEPSGNCVTTLTWDCRLYGGYAWQAYGVLAWMPLPESYKPEVEK